MKVRNTQEIPVSEYRKFGLLVGGIFTLIGCWPWIWRGDPLRFWALGVALMLAIPALVAPASLGPVYRGWMVVGHWLGWINTRILLGVVFFVLVAPLGMVRRLVGSNPLRLRFDKTLDTYRVVRRPRPGTHMTHQF